MSDAEDLARRFLALWTDYLTALLSDPKAADMLERWLAFGAGVAPPAAPGDDGSGQATRPPPGTAAAAGAFGERDDAVAQLARRVGELEQRLAALERGRGGAARGTRGRDRATRD